MCKSWFEIVLIYGVNVCWLNSSGWWDRKALPSKPFISEMNDKKQRNPNNKFSLRIFMKPN